MLRTAIQKFGGISQAISDTRIARESILLHSSVEAVETRTKSWKRYFTAIGRGGRRSHQTCSLKHEWNKEQVALFLQNLSILKLVELETLESKGRKKGGGGGEGMEKRGAWSKWRRRWIVWHPSKIIIALFGWMLVLASRLLASKLASPTGCFDLMPLPVGFNRFKWFALLFFFFFFFLDCCERENKFVQFERTGLERWFERCICKTLQIFLKIVLDLLFYFSFVGYLWDYTWTSSLINMEILFILIFVLLFVYFFNFKLFFHEY